MTAKLTGSLYTYQTHILYLGPLIASALHEHHAAQVMWVPGGVVVHDGGGARRVVTHVVPPNRPHGHEAAERAAMLYVERDDLRWDRAFPAAWELPARLDEAHPREIARALLAVVAEDRAWQPLHPAVRRMCALLDSSSGERELSIAELAQRSGLSVRQLRHRFTQELGLNPRAYLRWRRLRRAIACIERGANLTEAALEGGFADGAHLSRVFQAQFGMAPSQAVSSVRFAGSLD